MSVTSLFRAQCSAVILRSAGTSGLEPLAGCPPQSQSRAWPEGRSADVEVGNRDLGLASFIFSLI